MSDFIRLHYVTRTVDIPLEETGMTWPPPERIYLTEDEGLREAKDDDPRAHVLVRTNMSQLSDEFRDHPHLARGAEYWYEMIEEG